MTGGYNLLLGSGVTLDSQNSCGQNLPNTEKLQRELCRIVGVSEMTPLTRVSAHLSDEQRLKALTQPFSNCIPGPSLQHVPLFVWRTLFTFNIDDVLENLYADNKKRKQTLIPVNFDEPFQTAQNKSELLAIHLHGWVRKPDVGYVFSTSDYARIISSLNPWMHTLSEILSTEPFIIAGTSLNEVDLEYYLSHRTSATPRRGRGPSLLIHPNPDIVTKADCDQYGLLLVPATFAEFMEWLHSEFPSPPNIIDLVVPSTSNMFSRQPKPEQLIEFFSDFELVKPLDLPLPAVPSKFMYGREPEWRDLDEHLDIERRDNSLLVEDIKQRLASKFAEEGQVVIILDEAGTGKTTTIKRVGHDLALSGITVLSVCTTSRISTETAKECLKHISTKVLLLVDGIADHVEQVVELLEEPDVASKTIVLGSERAYRRDYLDVIFGIKPFAPQKLHPLSTAECGQLLERYRSLGLVGRPDAIRQPAAFARQILGDPVAIAVCRIMNDFHPLERIITSLWDASSPKDRLLYLCVALSEHCHKVGIPYSVLQTIAGPREPIRPLFDFAKPLNLAESPVDDDYVLAANSILAERILLRAVPNDPETLFSAFELTARALAPHVNRNAIMRRSPEARLSGRLFDYDKIVKPLLGSLAERFYVSVQHDWEWNSRYWEQRALLAAETDLQSAIQHARHAVAIELHPFPLTTLAKLLLKEMEADPAKFVSSYSEAFAKLTQAIGMEHGRSRVTVHPFVLLLDGTARYIELGGKLTAEKRKAIEIYTDEARSRFVGDSLFETKIQRLDGLL